MHIRLRRGRGPPLVLIHGSGTDGSRWAPVLPPLATRFSVYAVDRRGHGDSARAADVYRIEDEFTDLASLLDEIGDDRAMVVGHSYGALCALGTAAGGARLARLVLYEPPLAASPGAYCPPGLIETMRRALDDGDAERAAVAFATDVLRMTEPDIARRRRLALWAAMVAGAPLILRELESVGCYAMGASRFAGCTCPTLLLVGERSPPEYQATAAALAAALPNARIRALPGQAHGAIDAAPELFARVLLEFAEEAAPHQAG